MSADDFEPVRGLPEALPAGERMLWQGSPAWRPLLARAFYGRAIAFYFAGFAALRLGWGALDGEPFGSAAAGALMLLPFAVAALGLVALLAVLTARASVYTITDRRIVLRIGVALSVALNLPLTAIHSADLSVHGDGTGDIALGLAPDQRIAYLTLWPHARPWRLSKPEPMLRALAQPERVAGLLAEALSPGGAARAAQTRPTAATAGAVAPAGAALAS